MGDAESSVARRKGGIASGGERAAPADSDRASAAGRSNDSAREPADEGPSDEAVWHQSTLGAVVVVFDVLLVGAIAVGTTGALAGFLSGLGLSAAPPAVRVPGYVYLYGALGALAYVFTRLVRKLDRSTEQLLHSNVRVLAALPLAAGLYLFAGRFLGTDSAVTSLAGLSFLTGLFVNTAYHRINALGKRLFPAGEHLETDPDRPRPDTTSASGAEISADSSKSAGSTNRGGSGTPTSDGGEKR